MGASTEIMQSRKIVGAGFKPAPTRVKGLPRLDLIGGGAHRWDVRCLVRGQHAVSARQIQKGDIPAPWLMGRYLLILFI